jgi:hypothetical protein
VEVAAAAAADDAGWQQEGLPSRHRLQLAPRSLAAVICWCVGTVDWISFGVVWLVQSIELMALAFFCCRRWLNGGGWLPGERRESENAWVSLTK